LYKEAIVKNVYEGIDMRYYFEGKNLRYDYIVHPGADPKAIVFELEGQNDVYVKNGNICFTTRFGEVAMAELRTYQGANTIPSRFEKQGGVWKIAVGDYDKTKNLVIHPLVYSTYIGGSGHDWGYAIAVDGSGHAYVMGQTGSTDYDVTAGAFQTTLGGFYDVFVTKLNPMGSGLVYSTYLGGSGNDYAYGIAVDGSGHAYVTGWTFSTDYDVTTGAFQTINGGSNDVFVTKLSFMTTSIQDANIPDSDNLNVYPNPSNGNVVIEYYATEQGIAEIKDISGKLLQTFVLQQGRNDLNLNLPAGMYFLQEKNTGIVRKLIIE
jgi:hypothetical protein